MWNEIVVDTESFEINDEGFFRKDSAEILLVQSRTGGMVTLFNYNTSRFIQCTEADLDQLIADKTLERQRYILYHTVKPFGKENNSSHCYLSNHLKDIIFSIRYIDASYNSEHLENKYFCIRDTTHQKIILAGSEYGIDINELQEAFRLEKQFQPGSIDISQVVDSSSKNLTSETITNSCKKL